MKLTDFKTDINLLDFRDKLVFKKKSDQMFLKDPIRKKYVMLQPEEIVRQLFLCYLIDAENVNRNLIQVEKTIIINNVKRRFDIVVYDQQIQPKILVECKAPEIPITQATFDQAAMYNVALKAPYLIVTNGPDTYIADMDSDYDGYKLLKSYPRM